MINLWEGVGSQTEATAFCTMWGIEGTVLVDDAADYARQLGIRGVPTNVFVDANGIVTAVGAVAPRQLEAEIRHLLGPDAVIDPA